MINYSRLLEKIHTVTDRKILQKGTDSKEYQYTLVSVSLANIPNTIVNHFNISTIKKRIFMMNTKRSPDYTITRYVFLVPAVVALLLVFSLSGAEMSPSDIKSVTVLKDGTAAKKYGEKGKNGVIEITTKKGK